jgi:hypothetical protein
VIKEICNSVTVSLSPAQPAAQTGTNRHKPAQTRHKLCAAGLILTSVQGGRSLAPFFYRLKLTAGKKGGKLVQKAPNLPEKNVSGFFQIRQAEQSRTPIYLPSSQSPLPLPPLPLPPLPLPSLSPTSLIAITIAHAIAVAVAITILVFACPPPLSHHHQQLKKTAARVLTIWT